MFPKQEFQVQITDERLLNSKRGTVKRQGKTRDYSLMITKESVTINPAIPYTYKDYLLMFAEGEVDLTRKNNEKHLLTVKVKPMIRGIFICFCIILSFSVFVTISQLINGELPPLFFIILIPCILFYQYRQFNQSVELMAKKLEEDSAMFLQ